MASSTTTLRKAVNTVEAIDAALRWSILERVNDCVKELQLKCTSERSNALINDEATNSFLWVLEAVFIHGLTNSFLKSMSPFTSFMSSFSSGSRRNGGMPETSSTPVPNPSFWEFVLVFLHRDIIDQINSLHLVHTDVGRCRAWLRIALNEGLLLSFLENMTLKSNKRCVKAFYRSTAFLRDAEKCDIMKNYLMGIELLDFRLVINNSFLNHWNSGPLSLVGLWVDENESVQQGVDVAQNIESKEFQAIPKLQQEGVTPPRFYSELDSLLKKPAPPLLSEDDALKIILGSSPRLHPQPPVVKPSPPPVTSSSSNKKLATSSPSKSKPSKGVEAITQTLEVPQEKPVITISVADVVESPVVSVGSSQPPQPEATKSSSVIDAATISSSNDSRQNGEVANVDKTDSMHLEKPPSHVPQHDVMVQSTVSLELESPVQERSYTDMLLKYQQRHQKHNQQECLLNESSVSSNASNMSSSGLEESHNSTGNSFTTSTPSASVKSASHSKARRRYKSQVKLDLIDGLDLITSPRNSPELIMELLPRISKYTKVLVNEIGLDDQNYACKLCGASIGMIYGPARLCNFTGFSYCASCHENQESTIPSRILLNWDFGLYPVCKQAHEFLDDLHYHPIFDVQEINHMLYNEIDEFGQVKALRTKLYYIGMYLKTCKNTKALEELKHEAQSKDYYLDSIHMYSLSDLLGIPSRSLASTLTKLVNSGSGHILSCTICREKGFICEICRKPQVVFPFELERIFKCGSCGAVYHNTCMTFGMNCPRCERWKNNKSAIAEDEFMQNDCENHHL